jgi:hypothetical protein
MSFIRIIKWASLIFSFASITTYLLLSHFGANTVINERDLAIDILEETILEESVEPEVEVEVIETEFDGGQVSEDESSEALEEIITVEMDCIGIINAFESQLVNNIHDISNSLRENYNDCLQYGQPNPPEINETENNAENVTKPTKEKVNPSADKKNK